MISFLWLSTFAEFILIMMNFKRKKISFEEKKFGSAKIEKNNLNKLQTFTDIKALNYYTLKFRRLRVDRAHGVAPHKPILLLSVIELVKVGLLKKNQIYLSIELIETFLHLWSYLGSELHNPDISKPFFHLKGDKFWHLIPNKEYRKVINSKVKLKTFAEVKQAVKYAYIDNILFELLQNQTSRENLTHILLKKWFNSNLDQYEELKSNIFREKLFTIKSH